MRRRDFIKNAALSAIAISTTGFIRFDGKRYVGDCETTSDVLGPFPPRMCHHLPLIA